MFSAPERLTAFGARTYHDNNGSASTVKLFKPLNLRELYTT
jgi:hypothetical protein